MSYVAKPAYKSSTFWAGLAQIVGGIGVIVVTGDVVVGGGGILTGIWTILGRKNATQPLKFTSGK